MTTITQDNHSMLPFSDRALTMLNRRQLSSQEIEQFGALLEQAKQSQQQPKVFLEQLSTAELALVQKAHALADTIQIQSLSTEGATNLLIQPDPRYQVDLDRDGMVDVGAGQMIVFPPSHAPQRVHDAWQAATAGMSGIEQGRLQLRMHGTIYGFRIAGLNNSGLVQEREPHEVWSQEGLENLIATLHSQLRFAVKLDGWTPDNKQFQNFLDIFEQKLFS